jgi:putative membrane protein
LGHPQVLTFQQDLSILLPVLKGDPTMWGDMMAYMGNDGWGHMLFGGFMMVLFWGAVIALAVFLVRGLTQGRGDVGDAVTQRQPTALDLLQERYARGEINQREYEQRKRDLVH